MAGGPSGRSSSSTASPAARRCTSRWRPTPTAEVRALESSNVRVTDYVSDTILEALYESADVAIVPMRYGGGVKGKIIEAMRFGVPTVTTSVGIQGIPNSSRFLRSPEDTSGLAEAVIRLLADPAGSEGTGRGRGLFPGRALFARAGREAARARYPRIRRRSVRKGPRQPGPERAAGRRARHSEYGERALASTCFHFSTKRRRFASITAVMSGAGGLSAMVAFSM